MKPYYQDGAVTLYHGDCREMLASIEADAVVTDPPYGTTNLPWDQPVPEWASLLRPMSAWVFGSFRSLVDVCVGEFSAWTIAQEIVWEKHNGTNLHNDRFRRVHELAVHFYRGDWSEVWKAPQFTNDAVAKTVRKKRRPKQWLGETAATTYTSMDGGPRLMRSVIRARSCHGLALHPTQKPVEIVAPLVAYSVPDGGTVLDPFAGSGTTLVAAKNLGRRAIGVEINEKYCEFAASRLSQGVLELTDSLRALGDGGKGK